MLALSILIFEINGAAKLQVKMISLPEGFHKFYIAFFWGISEIHFLNFYASEEILSKEKLLQLICLCKE